MPYLRWTASPARNLSNASSLSSSRPSFTASVMFPSPPFANRPNVWNIRPGGHRRETTERYTAMSGKYTKEMHEVYRKEQDE
jgi:hypothetical protein